MPRPFSVDLRQRVVQAYLDHTGSLGELAAQFQVHRNSVWNWVQRYRQTRELDPKPIPGGLNRKITRRAQVFLQRDVRQHADATHAERIERLHDHTGIRVSLSTLGLALQQLNLTRKKSRCEPANA